LGGFGITCRLGPAFAATAYEEIHQMISYLIVTRIMKESRPGTIARQSDLDDFGNTRPRTVAHQHNAVGQQYRLVDVVRDHEDRLPGGLHNGEQFVLYGAACQRIERPEGLVEQQHLRLNGEGARNAHTLLHASGQFRGLPVCCVAQAHHVEIFKAVLAHTLSGPRRIPGAHAEGDIFQRAQPRKKRMSLEHDTAVQGRTGKFAPRHDGHAAAGLIEPRQYVENGGLAATGMTQYADELPGIDAEAHVLEYREIRLAACARIHLG